MGLGQEILRPAEARDHALEPLGRRARVERTLQRCGARLDVLCQPAEREEFGAERECHPVKARVALRCGQIVDGVADFDRIAGGAGERLVHIGDERDGREPGAAGHGGDAFRQLARALERRHEGAGPRLYIHDESLKPGGELLRQDRGGDERDRFDRRRHVADGVEAPVGGRQIGRLADDRAAGFLHDAPEEREVGLGCVARNRIELVERAAGVAEAAAGDHRHEGAGSRQHRRQHQRHVVADPAGRMLVEDRAGEIRLAPVDGRAGAGHGAGERNALVECHAAEEHRHGESGSLPLGDVAGGEADDELADVGFAENPPVAFGADDLLRQAHDFRPGERG